MRLIGWPDYPGLRLLVEISPIVPVGLYFIKEAPIRELKSSRDRKHWFSTEYHSRHIFRLCMKNIKPKRLSRESSGFRKVSKSNTMSFDLALSCPIAVMGDRAQI